MKGYKTPWIAGAFAAGCLAANAQTGTQNNSGLPNILIFLMDDMGYGDCRVYNPEGKLPMPNLEKMATQGMVFTDAHSASAVCAPSRYSLLTGNYPWRGRNENGTWGFSQPSQILPGQETMGVLLKRAGYQNAFFGKVHLGGAVFDKQTGERLTGWKVDYHRIDFSKPIGEGPIEQGFDYSYILPSGIQNQPFAFFENDRLVPDSDSLILWKTGRYGNSQIDADGFGAPDWDSSQAGPKLTEKALAFIDRHVEANRARGIRTPFYMHYCCEACHAPQTPPEKLLGTPVKGVSGICAHLDMIYEGDVTLGKLIDHLRELGELDNTLIIFTSDNGGLPWGEAIKHGHNSSGVLRGGKASIWEGGHRIPFIARWGDGTAAGSEIPPGTRSTQLIGLQDIYATFAELTGQKLQKNQGLDSQSFLRALRNSDCPPVRDHLFVQANDENVPGQRLMKMLREGAWKLVVTKDLEPASLFNLDRDLEEKNDLLNSPEQRERVQQMTGRIKEIMKGKRSTPVADAM